MRALLRDMRSWTLVGAVAVALAAGLGVPPVMGGAFCDDDGDGVGGCGGAGTDNCSLVPNGPVAGTGSCVAQEDGDMDGYGNPCDSDFNNDGATGPDDLSAILYHVLMTSTDLNFDLNCDGAAGPNDLSRVLTDVLVTAVPGPSDLPCAGTIPCP